MLKTTISFPLPAGFLSVASLRGLAVEIAPDGIYASDAVAVQALFTSYSGSAGELQWWKDQQTNSLAVHYASLFAAGFNYTVPGDASGKHNYQIDADSQAHIAAAGSLALACIATSGTWPSNYVWVDANNANVSMATAPVVLGFAQASAGYVTALILQNRNLKNQISAATSVSAVQAISLTQGWPSNP